MQPIPNVRTIAVSTGGVSYQKLAQYKPDALFTSFAEIEKVLGAILQLI